MNGPEDQPYDDWENGLEEWNGSGERTSEDMRADAETEKERYEREAEYYD